MKFILSIPITIIRLTNSIFNCSLSAEEVTKRSIETVMAEAMKGSNSLHREVSLGQASDAETLALLDYYKSLHGEKPPKGDETSWTEKTHKLVLAVQSIIEKRPGGTDELQLAGNCKACHSIHRND